MRYFDSKSIFSIRFTGLLLVMGFIFTAGTVNARLTANCDTTVVGPGTEVDIQAAVDASSPGDTICLDGAFALANPVEIRDDKVGLTVTSLDRDNHALLTATGFGLRLIGTNGVTISYLDIVAGSEGVRLQSSDLLGFVGQTSDFSLIGNDITAPFGIQAAGQSIESTETDSDYLIADNTIHAISIGLILTHNSNAVVRNNYIEVTTPFHNFGGGLITTISDGRLTVTDNVFVGPGGPIIGAIQYGIHIDHFIFPNQFETVQNNLDIKRNTISGFHTGIEVLMSDNPFPRGVTDLDLLKNDITCNPFSGTNLFGAPPAAVALLNLGATPVLDDVQLINNKLTDCDVGLFEIGNVTNVRALGPPMNREAMGFDHPPANINAQGSGVQGP